MKHLVLCTTELEKLVNWIWHYKCYCALQLYQQESVIHDSYNNLRSVFVSVSEMCILFFVSQFCFSVASSGIFCEQNLSITLVSTLKLSCQFYVNIFTLGAMAIQLLGCLPVGPLVIGYFLHLGRFGN